MRINLIGSQQKGLAAAVNNQESINCYAMASPQGRNGIVQAGSPGTSVFSTTTGRMRGCIDCADKAYFVIGQALYLVEQDGTATHVGVVPGAGRVSMAATRDTVIVVNGTDTGLFYNVDTETFAAVVMPYAARSVALLDGYAIFVDSGQTFFISAVNAVSTFDALDFAQAGKSSDDLVAVIEDHSELFFFGKYTTEPWYNAAGVDFPFSQNTAGIIERGLYAAGSLVKDDNTVFFLGDDLVVYRLNGYTPARISSDGIESSISEIFNAGGAGALSDAFAFAYTDHGHKFYQLTIPDNVTLVFDVATNEWHTKKHWNYETHHAVCYVNCYGKHLIGAVDGQIYEMSRKYLSDGEAALKRGRRSTVFAQDNRLLHWKEIQFIMDFGTTPLLVGQGSDPKMVVRFSNDNGRTWGNEKLLDLGSQGNFLAKAIKRHCGSSRARTIEFYVTDPVPFFVIDAYAVIT
jgi:hypothetical protein